MLPLPWWPWFDPYYLAEIGSFLLGGGLSKGDAYSGT